MNTDKRIHILELCSEDAYSSWTFWSNDNREKTETECMEIVKTVDALVQEKKLIALEHKSDGSFIEVPFDVNRLENEVRQSMISDTGPDTIYWFEASPEGKEEDLFRRRAQP